MKPRGKKRAQILRRLSKEIILVIMGGGSREREISLRSGKIVMASIRKLGLRARRIDPRKGIPKGPGLALICLHGKGGEDGEIQRQLDARGIVFPTTGATSSYICHDKILASAVARDLGVRVPRQIVYKRGGVQVRPRGRAPGFPGPYVIKPAREGSSFGIFIFPVWRNIPVRAFSYPDIFVEKFIPGREITQSLLILKEKIHILPYLELKPVDEPFYNLKAKYTPGATKFILRPRLARNTKAEVDRYGRTLATRLELRGMARADYRIDSRGRVFFLEVNTIPGLTETSDFPAQARAAGITGEDFAFLLLEEALSLKGITEKNT